MANFQIIFEDEQFLVLNKPAGIVVNKSDSAKEITVQEWMEEKLASEGLVVTGESEIEKEFISRGGVVHRLDKDTSGLLLLAKNPESFEKLKDQFKERTVAKKYLTLVHGDVKPPEGQIDAPIERSPFNRMHFGVFPGGREAQTIYRKQANYERIQGKEKEVFSLLEVEPKTGRTHQIRVHMKYVNHPVVSDPIYGGRKNLQQDLEFCPRLFLHAFEISFLHPITGEKLAFKAELPPELQKVLDESLRKI
jgi:23S rRNA pseudouridine1911/1915/1917 synthase